MRVAIAHQNVQYNPGDDLTDRVHTRNFARPNREGFKIRARGFRIGFCGWTLQDLRKLLHMNPTIGLAITSMNRQRVAQVSRQKNRQSRDGLRINQFGGRCIQADGCC